MASILKQVIIDILDRAKSIQDYPFYFVAVFNDHFNRIAAGSSYSFQLPAFFIEIVSQEYNQLGVGVTQSDLIIRLHIGHEQLDAGDGTLDQNLDVFDYRDRVKVAFSGFQPKNCTPMFEVDEAQDYQHDNVYHYTIDFKTGFIDTKGSPLDPDSTVWKQNTNAPLDACIDIAYERKEDSNGVFSEQFTEQFS